MKENTGGTKVKGGFYWNKRTWELVTVNGKRGMLPGKPEDVYVKVPTLVMLAGAPVLGGTLVLFLPFIGFALLISAVARKAAKPFKAAEPRPAEVKH